MSRLSATHRFTAQVQGMRLVMTAGHQSDVDVVHWHPNSHYLATGSSDRSIRLWDIRDASTARVFVGHRSPVSSCCPAVTHWASLDLSIPRSPRIAIIQHTYKLTACGLVIRDAYTACIFNGHCSSVSSLCTVLRLYCSSRLWDVRDASTACAVVRPPIPGKLTLCHSALVV